MQFEIKKVVTGYAYPKNGNAHNPTPKTVYLIYRDGQLIGTDLKLKDAKQFVSDIQSGVYA